ncbi:MAG: hypothetical protein ACR2NP_16865 [Pirellulaceae bacterium]
MIKRAFLLVAAAACLLATPATKSLHAAPIWDIDYALYVLVEAPKWEIWIHPNDGPSYIYGTYYSTADATLWEFKLYEHNLLPPGATTSIVEGTYMKWHYWTTYETWAEANNGAMIFQSYGYETKITPVFGGYIYPVTASAAETQTMMYMARLMDNEGDSSRKSSSSGRGSGR